MGNHSIDWSHAGITNIDDSGRIRVPDRIFKEEGILSVGSPVYFSYDKVVKVLVASNRELEKDEYKDVDFNKLGDESDNYRVTIPSQFFEDKSERGDPNFSRDVPKDAQVTIGERRHFMYHSEMAEGDIRSCYLFSDAEFNKRFDDSDRWDGKLNQVPEFL